MPTRARLQAEVDADISGLVSGVSQTKSELNDVSKAYENLAKSIDKSNSIIANSEEKIAELKAKNAKAEADYNLQSIKISETKAAISRVEQTNVELLTKLKAELAKQEAQLELLEIRRTKSIQSLSAAETQYTEHSTLINDLLQKREALTANLTDLQSKLTAQQTVSSDIQLRAIEAINNAFSAQALKIAEIHTKWRATEAEFRAANSAVRGQVLPGIVGGQLAPGIIAAGLQDNALSAAQALKSSYLEAFTSISNKAKEVGRTMSFAFTLPVAGIIAEATKANADFEQSILKIKGLTTATADEVANIRAKILQVAPDVGRMPKEMAEGAFLIESAGIHAQKALDLMTISAKAAEAGIGTTDVIARAAAGATVAYGQANLSASTAVDTFVAIVKEGKVAIDTVAPAIGRLLPIAAELGVSLPNIGAAIASITRTGISADRAVTSLSTALSVLLKGGKQTDEALKIIGYSTNKLVDEIGEKGLLNALIEVDNKFKEQGVSIAALFPNQRALAGILALVGKNQEENVKIFEHFNDVVGSAEGAFKNIEDSSQHALNKMKASINDAAISLGGALAPSIKIIADDVANAAKSFASLDAGTQQLIVDGALLLATVGPILYIFGQFGTSALLVSKVAQGFKTVSAAITTLKEAEVAATVAQQGLTLACLDTAAAEETAAATGATAWAAALGPITLIIAALAAVGYGIYKVVEAVNAETDAHKKNYKAILDNLEIQKTAASTRVNELNSVRTLVADYNKLHSIEKPTVDEVERMQDLLNHIGKLDPDLISGWTDMGNAVGLVNDAVDRLNESIATSVKLQQEVARQQYHTQIAQLQEQVSVIETANKNLLNLKKYTIETTRNNPNLQGSVIFGQGRSALFGNENNLLMDLMRQGLINPQKIVEKPSDPSQGVSNRISYKLSENQLLAGISEALRNNTEQLKAKSDQLALYGIQAGNITSALDGVTKKAEVAFRVGSDQAKLNKNLVHDLTSVSKELGMKLYVGTAITGHSEYVSGTNKVSRHAKGGAVDITTINGVSLATEAGKKLGDALAARLEQLGFTRNKEGSDNPKSVLWQMAGHKTHLHVSDVSGIAGSGANGNLTVSELEAINRQYDELTIKLKKEGELTKEATEVEKVRFLLQKTNLKDLDTARKTQLLNLAAIADKTKLADKENKEYTKQLEEVSKTQNKLAFELGEHYGYQLTETQKLQASYASTVDSLDKLNNEHQEIILRIQRENIEATKLVEVHKLLAKIQHERLITQMSPEQRLRAKFIGNEGAAVYDQSDSTSKSKIDTQISGLVNDSTLEAFIDLHSAASQVWDLMSKPPEGIKKEIWDSWGLTLKKEAVALIDFTKAIPQLSSHLETLKEQLKALKNPDEKESDKAELYISKLFKNVTDQALLADPKLTKLIKNIREAAAALDDQRFNKASDKLYNDLDLKIKNAQAILSGHTNKISESDNQAFKAFLESNKTLLDMMSDEEYLDAISKFWHTLDLEHKADQFGAFTQSVTAANRALLQSQQTTKLGKFLIGQQIQQKDGGFALPYGANEESVKKLFDTQRLTEFNNSLEKINDDLRTTILTIKNNDPFYQWALSIGAIDKETGKFLEGVSKEQLKKVFNLQKELSLMTEFAKGVSDIFGQMIDNIQNKGFKGLFSSIYQGFKQLLIKMATEYLESQLYNALIKGIGDILGAGLGSIGGGSAGGSAGGGTDSSNIDILDDNALGGGFNTDNLRIRLPVGINDAVKSINNIHSNTPTFSNANNNLNFSALAGSSNNLGALIGSSNTNARYNAVGLDTIFKSDPLISSSSGTNRQENGISDGREGSTSNQGHSFVFNYTVSAPNPEEFRRAQRNILADAFNQARYQASRIRK